LTGVPTAEEIGGVVVVVVVGVVACVVVDRGVLATVEVVVDLEELPHPLAAKTAAASARVARRA
jgi:hypothetical protein